MAADLHFHFKLIDGNISSGELFKKIFELTKNSSLYGYPLQIIIMNDEQSVLDPTLKEMLLSYDDQPIEVTPEKIVQYLSVIEDESYYIKYRILAADRIEYNSKQKKIIPLEQGVDFHIMGKNNHMHGKEKYDFIYDLWKDMRYTDPDNCVKVVAEVEELLSLGIERVWGPSVDIMDYPLRDRLVYHKSPEGYKNALQWVNDQLYKYEPEKNFSLKVLSMDEIILIALESKDTHIRETIYGPIIYANQFYSDSLEMFYRNLYKASAGVDFPDFPTSLWF
ncbi:MAG TPA: hypothetical protein VNB90_05910 [Cytophagaceae bacterium]|jgi:hypothetical protein|nr:hypothetical protein [Cytophagaceae bacterium]